MAKLLRCLGFFWAAPVTLVGLLYVGAFSVLGWYKFAGMQGDSLVWLFNFSNSPDWLGKAWTHWGGHTIGQVVVLNVDLNSKHGKVTLRHEQEHTRQAMVLGVFWPILYLFSFLSIKLACPLLDPYRDNVFEASARRASGEVD